jgi:hypothetical protein
MAFVAAEPAFKGFLTAVDNGGETTTKYYDLVAANAADAVTAMGTVLSAFQAVSDCVVKSYGVTQTLVNDALTLPAITVQIENQAVVTCGIEDQPLKFATIAIPSPKATLFVGSSGPLANEVDIAEAVLVTYAGLFSSGDGVATISDGEFLGTIISGKRVHRKG